MPRNLPSPTEIIEELADRASGHVERMASTAFDDAYEELTSYHRFLLALSSSQDADGSIFSSAEITGYAWNPPHREWDRQYLRLFERAVARLPDDEHFVRKLAYLPHHLLSGHDQALPPNIARAILDLGPTLVARLEAWRTRRTTVEAGKGPAQPRLALAPSDESSYVNVMPGIVGAWEESLRDAPIIYRWVKHNHMGHSEVWSSFRGSWPYLWHHLSNTAYSLALAVWNEDESGSSNLREAFLRWPIVFDPYLQRDYLLRREEFLLPTALDMDWSSASAAISDRLAYSHSPLTPVGVFEALLAAAHRDAVLLISALILNWTMSGKQASDIGGRTADVLLRGAADDDDGLARGREPFSFKSLMMQMVRLETAGNRYRDGSYSSQVDRFVESVDNMTERRVVPGRVFTPSTLRGHADLLPALVAIVSAHLPEEGDDGVVQELLLLAQPDGPLPDHDESLREALSILRRIDEIAASPTEAVKRGVSILAPGRDAEKLMKDVAAVSRRAVEAIEERRHERLVASQVDATKLEKLRLGIESALLAEPPKVPFFIGVDVDRAGPSNAPLRELTFSGMEKAQLVTPQMGPTVVNFDESFISGSRNVAGEFAWREFCQRERIASTVKSRIESDLFWMEIAPLVTQIRVDPVLVVSRRAEGRVFRDIRLNPDPKLNIMVKAPPTQPGYIATVEGVDVFGADFRPGLAWLFSKRALTSIRYAETVFRDHHVEVDFHLTDELKGDVRVRLRPLYHWSADPIFELNLPDPEEGE